MPEFECYNSNRIGGNGPNSGLSYHVVRAFTSPIIAAGTLRLLTQDDRQKLMLAVSIAVDWTSASDKTVRLNFFRKEASPSILDPGIEVFRKFVPAGESAGSNGTQVYGGREAMTRIGLTRVQFWVPMGIYLDERMDAWFNFTNANDPVVDFHFLTGNPERLMEGQLAQNLTK